MISICKLSERCVSVSITCTWTKIKRTEINTEIAMFTHLAQNKSPPPPRPSSCNKTLRELTVKTNTLFITGRGQVIEIKNHKQHSKCIFSDRRRDDHILLTANLSRQLLFGLELLPFTFKNKIPVGERWYIMYNLVSRRLTWHVLRKPENDNLGMKSASPVLALRDRERASRPELLWDMRPPLQAPTMEWTCCQATEHNLKKVFREDSSLLLKITFDFQGSCSQNC